ncbi:MAG TPA: 30S ribosomal protein S8 [Candidatus Nanoarchaeia archaeon]|nr:30S ribosomal protein S8 [Candidatus Nanoarchaeia archaeon]
MSQNDLLSAALSKILNADKVAKKECTVKSSKVIKKVLEIMKENLYIGSFNEVNDGKGGLLEINLIGRLNQCGAIKPRYPIALGDFEKFEKRYMIAKDFGIIILSTSNGIMTHNEAKQKGLGGRLLAYCY